MKKRLIALLTVLVLAVSVMIPAAFAEDDTPSNTAGYYYVYTENGKGLNVRATAGGEIVGSLKYGTRIYCYYRDGGNGWALIDYSYNMPGVGYGTYACFVSSRYLRKSKPPARPGSDSSAQSAAATDTATEIMATYKANEKLLVIKELNNWYQVEDQDTGDVGFISKQFVVK